MGSLKKSATVSFAVQGALLTIGLMSYWLPPETAQGAVFLLFPFAAGIELGPMLMRPLVSTMSPDLQLQSAVMSALVGNFLVYGIVFYLWFAIRGKFYGRDNLPELA